MNFTCLIIDDEKVLADRTAEYFNLFDVKTLAVYSMKGALEFFKQHTTELILLDINLEDGSGLDLCATLRKNMDVPILFISARSSDDDKIVALNIGGDDYIQKPYSLGVLLAKVKVILKRYNKGIKKDYSDGYLTVNFLAKQVLVKDLCAKLTPLEFKLLTYLMENQGRVVSKTELFDKVWEDKFTTDGTLNVHIRKIREAIEMDPNHPKYILTIWGDGYIFKGVTA